MGSGFNGVTHQMGYRHLEEVFVQAANDGVGIKIAHQANLLPFHLRREDLQNIPDNGIEVFLAKKGFLFFRQGLEMPHHLLQVLGFLSNGRRPGPGGIIGSRLFQQPMAKAADDMERVANPIGYAQGHLRHGALHHQGLHLSIQGENFLAGCRHPVMVGGHAAV